MNRHAHLDSLSSHTKELVCETALNVPFVCVLGCLVSALIAAGCWKRKGNKSKKREEGKKGQTHKHKPHAAGLYTPQHVSLADFPHGFREFLCIYISGCCLQMCARLCVQLPRFCLHCIHTGFSPQKASESPFGFKCLPKNIKIERKRNTHTQTHWPETESL